MRIAVASGKGGTGKTTVAVNLAVAAARAGLGVHLCDCDVEEPNAHLYLEFRAQRTWPVTTPIPRVDPGLCGHCGACADICEFNAIASLSGQTLIFPDLCHGCGGCWLVCPRQAIQPVARELGDITTGTAGPLKFTSGRLRIGQTLVPPVIAAVKSVPAAADWTIDDAPPGTTCPVVTTLSGTDFVILVTEPTPFGLHDLALAHGLTRRLGLPAGVVINRAIGPGGLVEDFCRRKGLPVLARIPFSRRAARVCAEGGLILDSDPAAATALEDLIRHLKQREVAA